MAVCRLCRASLVTLRRATEMQPPSKGRDAWLAFWEMVERDGRFPIPPDLWELRPRRGRGRVLG